MQEYILVFDEYSQVIGFNSKGEAEAYALQWIDKSKEEFAASRDMEVGNAFDDYEGIKAAGIRNGSLHAYKVLEVIKALDNSEALEKEALKGLLEEEQIHFERDQYSEINLALDLAPEIQLFNDFDGEVNYPGQQ